jgi:hypothetical protein
MSTSTAEARLPADRGARVLRTSIARDPRRTTQIVLGLIWLLDGALQFQSFMYSKGFIQMLTGMTSGQPSWIASSMNWAAHTAQHNLTVYNTLFALVQCAIGLGILFRPTARVALIVSLAWAFIVWWFGEAFGMMFMSMASPLTGAPGAVLLYALIALIAFPIGRPGGLLGVRGARLTWAVLWLVMAWLWLEAPSADPNAIHDAINAAPSGMSWLSSVQDGFASVSQGNGVVIAMILAAVSAVIGVGVARNWRAKELLALAVGLNLLYWVVGQGFGGIFAGGATDPNAGPLFCPLAYALYTLIPYRVTSPEIVEPLHV